jgi:hypothetical protein
MITHFEIPDLSDGNFTDRATRAASLKASRTPRFFMAEHSATLLARFETIRWHAN